jgi:rhamnosyltransferase
MMKVSVIIRAKNEERWIRSCLKSVFAQSYSDIEVVLVDNNSSDKTLAIAEEFPVIVSHIDKFLPGKAINQGIRASTGELIVCLSGHCIPTNNKWLSSLVQELVDPSVAGVYGRQEPLSFSSYSDKRDLILLFGLDKRIQVKDPFFHNANSAFTRRIWNDFPFDEDATNIEDRLWGIEVQKRGFKLIYEPAASVYHWHGIHHGHDQRRAESVGKVLEQINKTQESATVQNEQSNCSVFVIIPVIAGKNAKLTRPLIDITLGCFRKSKKVSRIFLCTDSHEIADYGRKLGAEIPFIRDSSLSEPHISVMHVFQTCFMRIEDEYGTPDLAILAEITYPFREHSLVDEMIFKMAEDHFDSMISVRRERRTIFCGTSQGGVSMGEGSFSPELYKESVNFVACLGLCFVAKPETIRFGSFFDGRVGFVEVESALSDIEVRDESRAQLVQILLNDSNSAG